MADVVVTGGGMNGLTTAMLLARDGHEVTVLERDPAPPAPPDRAWETWERRGVNQFRMVHYLQPRWRELVEAELPELAAAVEAAGALRFNPVAMMPNEVSGGYRDDDDELTALTARRPVVESVTAAVAESTPGVDVRRGVAVEGFVTGPAAATGIPNVTGVRTTAGETIEADLVVDATGRRSPLGSWLEAAGGRPPVEEQEDSGFVYYGRHFRSADGSTPFPLGGILQAYESLSILTLPCDNGTWGVALVARGDDGELRGLRDAETWTRTVRSYPLVAHWVDGEPLDDVAVMARIPDRHRRFVVDDIPVATGVLAVGDSWACTNPSLGRGITMGTMHAVALRDLIRSGPVDDPCELALAWERATAATVAPWYESTLSFDRHRLAQIGAQIEGVPYEPGDPSWEMTQALFAGSGKDPDILRGLLRFAGLQQTAGEILAQPGFLEKVIEHGADWRDAQPPGPSRVELLDAVHG